MFNAVVVVSVLVAVSVLVNGQSQTSVPVMTWQCNGQSAISSISTTFTTLTYNNPPTQGAQFPYTLGPIPSPTYPLVTVQLVDTLHDSPARILQTGFDIINQQCRCYWLDANDLLQQFPDLMTGNGYVVRMVAPTGEILQSGLFGIDTPNKFASPSNTPKVETAAVTNDANSIQAVSILGLCSAILLAFLIY